MRKWDEDQLLMALRARARRTIQGIFAILALISLAVSLFIHHSAGSIGLSAIQAPHLANAFLFLGSANAATMWIWDWLFWHDVTI